MKETGNICHDTPFVRTSGVAQVFHLEKLLRNISVKCIFKPNEKY